MSHVDRMPPLAPAAMAEAQRRAADELAAGPRGGVKGPFIALLRSPELMDRLQRVGEYLRFRSALEQFGEQGVVDMLGLVGYSTTVSMIMNVAHTPAPRELEPFPL